MKKSWTKIFPFIFLFSVFGVGKSLAEYLIVEKNNEGLCIPAFEDYKKAIEIVMQWRFPLYLKDIERIKSLDEIQLKSLCENEQKFIENKFKEIGLNLELLFIPTIFYELFILTDFNLCKKLKLESIEYEKIEVPVFLEEGKTLLKYFIDSYNSCDYNNDFFISKKFYYKINNMIFDFVKENNFNNKSFFYKRLGFYKRKHNNTNEKEAPVTRHVLKYLSNNTSYFKKIFNYEVLAHEYGCFSLYRGTCGYNEILDLLKVENESMSVGLCGYGLSYGNSLFAGIFNDVGASAFTYIFDQDFIMREKGENISSVGYFLFIPKLDYLKEFIENGIENRLFIAPVNTLNGLISKGELFHSRVLAVCSDDRDFICNSRLSFNNYLKSYACIFKNRINTKIRIKLLNYGEFLSEINLPYQLFMHKRRQAMVRVVSADHSIKKSRT